MSGHLGANMSGGQPTGASLGGPIQALRDRWGWIVGIGIALSLCGLIALGNTVVATFAVVAFAGSMMIVSGIIEIIHGFNMKTWGRFFLWIVIGLLYVGAGIITVTAAPQAAAILTLLVGAAFVASGLVRIVLAFQMREGTPWIWAAISGLITALLGVMILAQWPFSGLYVLGLFLGVDLLFAGASWVTIGLALRRRA
ncbi:HdeD family acid-resistance protein [uncultured Alsobacter sp.]|uniref:HdeD family acid-resistance protein n=1 Tax=uncultured Alsobacter sp. TaxID=1748258 RepID=UPI0025CF3018|nr:HdeD family acid-resistance protein [uncultured Alsobacter sp.]